MNATAVDIYRARFRKVLEHIEGNLDGDLSVDRLSTVAAFSRYHFHRQFSELYGLAVHKYVQLCRLKRASYQLAFRGESRITDIALASGYDGPESFARAFRKNFGQSPSEFRKQPLWKPWSAIYQPLCELRAKHMTSAKKSEQVRIVNFNETRVAVCEHRGDPALIGDSIRKFIAWRKENKLSPKVSATFNVVYDDPAQVARKDYRIDICCETDREVEPNPLGIVSAIIPGGRCAVLRHVGSNDTLTETVRYLYAEWLPQSGEEPRDFPLFFQKIRFFPDVPESEAVTDVFLPLANRRK